MKHHGWVLVLAMVMILALSTVQAGSSRITFCSDRFPIIHDLDIYIMKEDGTDQTRETTETGDAKRPSYTLDGDKIVYDHGGDLWIRDSSGGTSQNLTDSDSTCHSVFTGADGCEDADAGPFLSGIGADGDFRVVFTVEIPSDDEDEIWMAIVDVSEEKLIEPKKVAGGPVTNYQPAWCGSDHIVWSRSVLPACEQTNPPSCEADANYPWELCKVEVDEDGPKVLTEECVLNTTANQYPSCGVVGRVLTVVFAQSPGDLKAPVTGELVEQPHGICTMKLDETTLDLDLTTLDCFHDQDDYDDNKPVFSPSGSQIAVASDRALEGPDYEIWLMNSNDGSGLTPLTINTDHDDDPNWGPANLP